MLESINPRRSRNSYFRKVTKISFFDCADRNFPVKALLRETRMAAAAPTRGLRWERFMAARIVPGFSKPATISHIKTAEHVRFRRRAVTAFLVGAGLFVTSATAMISQGADARGAFIQMVTEHFGDSRITFVPSVFDADSADGGAKSHHHRKAAQASFSAKRGFGQGGQPVCVRLCDGFFFPASVAASSGGPASEQASCDSLCPDAPTSLFYQSSNSDRIEDAISATGQRYTALPVALRYRSTQDNTCTCHHTEVSALSPLRDGTLRKGDAVMTASGFLVFHGAEQATHTRQDFASLSASAIPKDQRGALQALERVSQLPQVGAPRSWVLAQGPSWAPAPVRTWVATAAPSPRPNNAVANINVIRFMDPPDPATN